MAGARAARASLRALSAFGALASCVALASCGAPKPAQAAGPQWLIRMAVEHGSDHPSASAGKEIARLAERESSGRIRIRVYEDGYLGDESEVVEQLRFGGIDLAVVNVRALESLSKTAAELSRAGSFEDSESMAASLKGAAGESLEAELERQKLLPLAWFDSGPECYLLSRGFEGSLEGLRIGVEPYKAAIEAVSGAGATPVTLTAQGLRRALESGMVDGARASLATAVAGRLDAEYLVRPIPGSRVPVLVIGSKASLQKMPAKDRAILFGAVEASRDHHRSALEALTRRPLVLAEPWSNAESRPR